MSKISNNKKELSNLLKKRAINEGFAVAGIASIPGSSRLSLRTRALERWLNNNYHSEMKWMEADRRKNIESLLKGGKSVLSVGYNYLSTKCIKKNEYKIGKFGQGDDYHKLIKKKLKNLGQWIKIKIPDCEWKICIDTSPLLEKAWAEESGLGWIGKHSNLINKNNGSWLTLGFLILTVDLEPDNPSQSLCGKCEKCIEKCPTNAIVEPFVVKSDLCIAYHTIENRSKNIPKFIAQNLNGWIAGCDICQDICPWNQTVPFNKSEEAIPKPWINNLNNESLKWDDKKWDDNLKGTTLKRIKPWMWKRNIKAMLKNS